jgi:predicted aconitase
MRLTADEEEMLAGNQGPARRAAMDLLLRYAEALGADEFIDTNNVTLIAGTLPDLDVIRQVVPSMDIDTIASRFYLDSDETIVVDKVKAYTTSNATHRDKRYPKLQRGGQETCDFMETIEDYLRRIGVINLVTCTPYQAGNVPARGEHCAWIESSAQAYCNSILGARTNIEGQHSAFASAITGKTPLWGLHQTENRYGNLEIRIERQPITLEDWYLMGFHFGSRLDGRIPVYTNLQTKPHPYQLIAFSAAVMTTGSSCMFHIEGITPEAPTFEAATNGSKIGDVLTYDSQDRRHAYEEINDSDDDSVDVIVLGCPHYGVDQMKMVAAQLEGKKIKENVALFITTMRSVKALLDREGYTNIIEGAGATILEDSCGLVLDITDPNMVAASDSAKMSHYIRGTTGVRHVWFGTTQECIDAAISGQWRGRLK